MVTTMKLVYFDPNSGMVLAWLDTVAYSYGTLPPENTLMEITDEQYDAGQSGAWYVINGQLTETPPAPVA